MRENVLSLLTIVDHFYVSKIACLIFLKVALTANFYSYHWSVLSLSNLEEKQPLKCI